MPRQIPSRSHALRGNARTDAPRRVSASLHQPECASDLRASGCKPDSTQSVGRCVPTQSVGTRLLAFLGLLLVTASVASAQDAKPAEKVNFQDHILPIFRAKCGTCHSAG